MTRNSELGFGRRALGTTSERYDDYLVSLFAAQATVQQPPLTTLLLTAHKTLSTVDHYLDFREQQDCRLLKRIYHLQNSNRWSLRQLARAQEPERTATHWDILLAHMKEMRTDFREERKWKLTAAKNLADWCAECVATPAPRRALLQVRVSRTVSKSREAHNYVTPVSFQANPRSNHSEDTPELIPSADDDMSDAIDEDGSELSLVKAAAPAALFSLAPEDVLFSLDRTSVSDKLLSELPLYRPFKELPSPQDGYKQGSFGLDRVWRKALVPVSRFAFEKIAIEEEGPPRKKPRYDYSDDAPDEPEASLAPPEKTDVAMFNPGNQHIIARLHAAHAFRPPSEFSMPSQSFFESRVSSQWTWAEDDELRRLVKEYEYNWSLIANCLSSPSIFSSGAERRTPWECFERWVSFEGLPGEMGRHQYFKAWHARREGARKMVADQNHAQQVLINNNTIPATYRRRTTEPMRVEKRKNNKHLTLVHAMTKVAKKKEISLQKQQHGMASLPHPTHFSVFRSTKPDPIC
jgi:chromatin modification-related protein VID21